MTFSSRRAELQNSGAAPGIGMSLQQDFSAESRITTLKRRSVHGAATTALAQCIRLGLQLGSQVVLARLLAPSAFGLVAMVMPITGFVQLFNDMGLVQATIQRPTISRAELSALFWTNVVLSTLLAAVLAACGPLVAWFYHEPRTAPVTAALASLLFLGGLSAQPMALMNRSLRFLSLAVIDVAASVAAAAAGIGCALAGAGYWALVAMQAANSATILLLAWAFAGWQPSSPAWTPGVGALLRFGGHVTAYNVVNYFSYNLDNVLIGSVWGDVALGYYDRAFRLMLLPVMQVMAPFSRVALPLLSRLQDDPERYRAAYSRAIRAALLLAVPGIAFAIVMGRPLIVAVLGLRWSPTAPIFAWLGAGALAVPMNASLSWLFISQNRPRQQLLWCCTGTAMLVMSFVLGLPWGPVGVAASGSIVTWLLQTPMLVWAATRLGPVSLSDFGRAVYPLLIVALATLTGLWLAEAQLMQMGSMGLPLALAGAYATAAGVLGCWQEGHRVLQDVWALHLTFRHRLNR